LASRSRSGALGFIGDAAEHGERGFAVEWMLPGRGFIEHAAEAEQSER